VRFNISKVLDKYVGNTEKNFAEIVKILDSLIDSMRGRMVLWIDEIEKALPRSESSYSDRLK
jgi:SpoVK/Ycf46/Vps4 family AAA+-type ATPase